MFNWGEEPYFVRKNLKNIIAKSKKALPKFGILNKFLIIWPPPPPPPPSDDIISKRSLIAKCG
jgi:hypothetical protein